MPRPLAVALLTGSLGLGACGGGSDSPPPATPNLPAAQIAKIENMLKTANASFGDAPLRTVDCPTDVPAKVNGTFRCSASGGSGTGSVRVTLYNKQGTDVGYKSKVGGVSVTGRQDVK
jgi:hypothetical protein